MIGRVRALPFFVLLVALALASSATAPAFAASGEDALRSLESGFALREAGDFQRSSDAFRAVLAVEPDNPLALAGLALNGLASGRPSEADARLEERVADGAFAGRGFGVPMTAVIVGLLGERAGRTGDALAAYGRALDADPENVVALSRVLSLAPTENTVRYLVARVPKPLEIHGSAAELAVALARALRSVRAPGPFAEMLKRAAARAVALGSHKSEMATLAEAARAIPKIPEPLAPKFGFEETSPIRVAPVVEAKGLPLLRIGLSTRDGKSVLRDSVRIKVGSAFTLVGKDGVRLAGEARAPYTLEMERGRLAMRGGGRTIGRVALPARVVHTGRDATVLVDKVEYGSTTSWSGREPRHYRGNLVLSARGAGRFALVNEVDLENYVRSVLPGEMPGKYPLEALKAQAVAARSEAVHKMSRTRRHKEDGFDLCDDTHCQVYRGADWESATTVRACDETWGQILSAGDQIVDAVYGANCGGAGCSSAEVGWGPSPYLVGHSDLSAAGTLPDSALERERFIRGRPSIFCAGNGVSNPNEARWSRLFEASELSEAVGRRKPIGRIRAMLPLRRDPTGHIRAIRFVGTSGTLDVSGELEIRRAFGPGLLRSSLFVVDPLADEKGTTRWFLVTGAGFGHGVGLCQCGAAGHAKAGRTHRQILAHYFRGAEVGVIYSPPRSLAQRASNGPDRDGI